jgi:hypothetical protein
LASAGHEIEPPFCCVDVNGSWRVVALKIDEGARNWPRGAAAIIKEGTERTDDVFWLWAKAKLIPLDAIMTDSRSSWFARTVQVLGVKQFHRPLVLPNQA